MFNKSHLPLPYIYIHKYLYNMIVSLSSCFSSLPTAVVMFSLSRAVVDLCDISVCQVEWVLRPVTDPQSIGPSLGPSLTVLLLSGTN